MSNIPTELSRGISGKQTMDDIVNQVSSKSVNCMYVLQRVVDKSHTNEAPVYKYIKAQRQHVPYKTEHLSGTTSGVIPLLALMPEDEQDYETSDPDKARLFLDPWYAIEIRDKVNAVLTKLHPFIPLYSLGTMFLVANLSKAYPTKNNLMVRLVRKDGDVDTALSHIVSGRRDTNGDILTFSLVKETQNVISGQLFGSLQGAEKFKEDIMSSISPECRMLMQQYEAWHVSCTMVPALTNIDSLCSRIRTYNVLNELGLIHYSYTDGEQVC